MDYCHDWMAKRFPHPHALVGHFAGTLLKAGAGQGKKAHLCPRIE